MLNMNKETKDYIKAIARVPDFAAFCAMPTHGYFARLIEQERKELAALRDTLAGFGYCTE